MAFSLTTTVFAQSTHINVFSDKGERFWVIINGIKQNTKASQHVKITSLTGTFWKMRVVFENQNIPEVSQNIGTMEADQELTYQIKQNRKGAYVARIFSATPISGSTSKAETTISYRPNEQIENTTILDNAPNTNNLNGFSLKADEKGIDFNVNIDTTRPVIEPQNNTRNCSQPMLSSDFYNAKKAVDGESFDENKMQVSQQFTKNNCVSVAQIKEIMELFSFEENKLEYAKYAYDFCADKGNYYQLNSVFNFSSTKDALNEFLKKK